MDGQAYFANRLKKRLSPDRVWNRLTQMNQSFLVIVVVPTLLSTLYLGFMASDVYTSESRFVIRSSEKRPAMSGLGAILEATKLGSSHDDSYTVGAFITSRDALSALNRKFSLAEIYGRNGIDLFSRFGALPWRRNFEALHRYYQGRVGFAFDPASSISTLSVKAYTSEDAYKINAELLKMSEALINTLNDRARQDTVKFAASNVARAEARARNAALAVSNYRNAHGVFDPERQSALQLATVSKIQERLIAARAQLMELQALSPASPQIPGLRHEAATLQEQIDRQTATVAGSARSLAGRSPEYDRLMLDQAYADKALEIAMATLQQAQNDARNKQLYLVRIVQPNRPDVSYEPNRLKGIASVFLLSLIVWGCVTIFMSGVREHKH